MAPVNQTDDDSVELDSEELHELASDQLLNADESIMLAIQTLDKLRTKLSEDKTDPMYAKVSKWYTTLLTNNVVTQVADEMQDEDSDSEPDESADEEPSVTIVLSQAQAKALRQGAAAAQQRQVDPITEEEGVLFAEAVDILELAIS